MGERDREAGGGSDDGTGGADQTGDGHGAGGAPDAGGVERGVHLPVAAQPSLDALVALGEHAEAAGYDRVWVPETWGRDAVTTLAVLAERTDSVGLGTSIAPVYSRSPALLGQTAATLADASDGRLRLGLGPSGPAVIEGWHGRSYDRPLRQTRETLDVIRAVLSGDVVEYDGECVQVSGFRLRCDPPAEPVPLDVSGMGPKAVELAGRFADGWHAIMLSADGLRDRLGDLRRGADLGDRDPGEVRVTAVLPCCALPDGDLARDLARQHLAFYVGGMGTFYRDALARQGHEATAEAVQDAWTAGERERAVGLVDDDLLAEFAAAGTPRRARERLDAVASVPGVDSVAVSFPRGADGEVVRATVDALAPE